MSDNVTIIQNGKIEYATVKQTNGDLQELSIQRRALPVDDRSSVASVFPSSFSFGHHRHDYYYDSLLPDWWSEKKIQEYELEDRRAAIGN
jgi:hypothetical protein